MNKIILTAISFGIAFSATALLCIAKGYPLVYYPVDYGWGGFIRFGVLILFLSLALVYVNFPVLKWIKGHFEFKSNPTWYYVVATVVALQVFTMIVGRMESRLTRGVEADLFYYYKCVSNSCLYIFSGNLAAIVSSYLYGKSEYNVAKPPLNKEVIDDIEASSNVVGDQVH